MYRTLNRVGALPFAIVVALSLSACRTECPSSEEKIADEACVTEFSVETAGHNTRTHFGDAYDGKIPVYWSSGDRINVNGTDSEALADIGEGTAVARFSMRGVSAPYRVIYPAESFVASVDDAVSVVSFPSAQTYAPNSFAEGAALMFARSDATDAGSVAVNLEHLCGVLCFPLKKPSDAEFAVVDRLVLTASSAEPIAGDFELDFTTGELTATADATDRIVMDFGAQGLLLDDEAVDVYVALPKGVYAAVDIDIIGADGKLLTATWGGTAPVEVVAGRVVEFGDIEFEPTHYDIRSSDDWERFVAAVDAGDYSEWINPRNGEVNLRADIATDGQFSRIRSDWSGTFNGNGHTMTQGASTVSLFTRITSEGIVKNLILEGSSTSVSNPSSIGTAALAQINLGTVENVINRVNVSLPDLHTSMVVCGMVVCNGGIMRDCVQEGDISVRFDLASASATSYAGGISCFATDAVEAAGCTVCGSFIDCANKGDIRIDKTGTGSYYLGKYTIGGICAIVHRGTADDYSLFERCRNEGYICRRDDSSGSNTFSSVGGIVGRIADYTTQGAVDVAGNGFYARIVGCTNTGTVENSPYLTNGFPNTTVSGARLGHTGGIVGYSRGSADRYVEISECTNTGDIRGGHSRSSVILGGIAGMTSFTHISSSSSVNSFYDAVLPSSVTLTLGTIGGLIGYVRDDTSIEDCAASVAVDVTATVSYCGLAAGGVYSPSADAPALTVGGSKFGGSFRYSSGAVTVDITPTNYSRYLCPFGRVVSDDVGYWDGM